MSSKRTQLPPGVKIDFNALKPPPGYVPGAGRGASGFTTRSDVGPSMPAPDMPLEAITTDDSKFDAFMGNDVGVFSSSQKGMDEEDKEAEAIWESVDARMDERRKAKREAKAEEGLETFRRENPNISEQFSDLKRQLATVDASEWESIPDIGDYTNKKRRMEQFVPVPDNMLAMAADRSATVSAVEASVGGATTADLTAIGEGRNTVVKLKLDRISDSVSGQTVVDPKGYLTDLKSVTLKSDAEISDIKKARLLLKSVINTNPKHAPGWIAAARLEEVAGKLADARQMSLKGCELCPGSEDLWIEAARLQTPENAKGILARGVAALPDSVNIWMHAANLESDAAAKKRVLLRALERIPESVRLWKAVVEISDENDARILLSRAVECCPQHVELWLALARLETYKNAQKILNRARQAIPTSSEVWITASKLEESQGNQNAPAKIIPRAVKSLKNHGVVIDRQWWIEAAESAEKSEPPMVETCKAIVSEVIDLDIEEEDKKRTWLGDAEECIKNGSIETARAIYSHALERFPTRKGIWRRAAMMEKNHGKIDSMFEILQQGVQTCPQAEVLWLMAAKEKWLLGDIQGARSILEEAFLRNPDSEDIWLAAFKVEFESGEFERARVILAKAREHPDASSERVWIKSAVLERFDNNVDAQRDILHQGIKKYPTAWKLHIMLGQMEQALGNTEDARRAYSAGLRECPHAEPLWIASARLEEEQGAVAKARAILEKSRLKNPKNEILWLHAYRTEYRNQNLQAADTLMARALQECPESGILWAEYLSCAPRTSRKSRSVDALKRCHDNPHVIAAVAAFFVQDRKIDKARTWLTRAITLNSDIGDFWAALYRLECQHGTEESANRVIEQCKSADPHHGERWQRVAKAPAKVLENTEILKEVADTLDEQL